MAEVINRRRNIFVNSEEYHQSNGNVNLLLPALDFNVSQNEMKCGVGPHAFQKNPVSVFFE